MNNNSGCRNAFTLIELLVVIGVVGVLVGIALPAVQIARESGRRATCANNLRQIALGIGNFESARQRLPVGITAPTAIPHRSMSWLTQLLPFVEQPSLWEESMEDYNLVPSPFSGHTALATPVSTYACPSDVDSGIPHYTHSFLLVASTSYVGINGTDYTKKDGVFYQESRTRIRDIVDGTSNTLMIGERPPSSDFWYGWWYAGRGQVASGSPDMILGVREKNDGALYLETCPPGPYNFTIGKRERPCDTFHFWSYHPGGANFVMADGSVHFLAYGVDEVFPQLATRAGSEVASLPD